MNQHGTIFLLLLISSLSGDNLPNTSESSLQSNVSTIASDGTILCDPSVNNSTCATTTSTAAPTVTVIQQEIDSMRLCLALILLLLALTSSGFLIAYLRTSFKKKGPKTLLLKITSSYCVTLLFLYIASVISFILLNVPPLERNTDIYSRVAKTIIEYSVYSLFLWSCFITYECWQCFIRFKDYKVDSNQSKRRRQMDYLIRCCFAWITPILMPINSSFCPFPNANQPDITQSTNNDTLMSFLRCPKINNTNINDTLLYWADFVVDQNSSSPINLTVTVVLAMCIILPFVHICVRFRSLLIEVGDADMNNSKKKRRYRYIVYAKLLCITGAFWVLSSFLIFLDNLCPSIGIVVCFLLTAYGILLCISLGKKNHSFYNILRGHMNRVFIRRFPDSVSMSQVRMTR
ncbi:uncharacterized protein LOC135841049 isoform X2 [Planococcus citri]|uniref:uncharacterized protein LOC135841049 isoform X2 n=1 Tax=Planococcus citri TaxID=170843 RepID=UPI0031F948FC